MACRLLRGVPVVGLHGRALRGVVLLGSHGRPLRPITRHVLGDAFYGRLDARFWLVA